MTQEQYRRELDITQHAIDLYSEELLMLRGNVRHSLSDTKYWVELVALCSERLALVRSYRARLIKWYHGSRIGNPPTI
jgi:hypothetical protein